MESYAFLVSFVEKITPYSGAPKKNERRAIVMAEDHGKAIEYVKKLVSVDEKTSKGIISYDGFVSSSLRNQDILLDNGTFATKNNIFYENDIINRNEVEN